eukprot:m.27293 g.27293  ORF g.27293 m.27293 type:complete len:56 (-) comp13913_c0_seq3:54-221(-)
MKQAHGAADFVRSIDDQKQEIYNLPDDSVDNIHDSERVFYSLPEKQRRSGGYGWL